MAGDTVSLELQTGHAILAAFVVGVLAGGFFVSAISGFTGFTGDTAPKPGNSEDSDGSAGVSVSNFDFKNDPVIGSPDAPVTIVAWEDYQCPFCKRFEQNTYPQIKENYIDTGKVRFVFKDFAFLGPDSAAGAVASQCVWRQVGDGNPEAWSTWKNSMFDNQDGENSGWGNQEDIITMTRDVNGVDASRLESCMNNSRQEIQQEISTDRTQGQNSGISGTPGFVVYGEGDDTGTKIVGAQPYSRFQSVIESKLSG